MFSLQKILTILAFFITIGSGLNLQQNGEENNQLRLQQETPVQTAKKIELVLYMESLCPFCRQFLFQQIQPAYETEGVFDMMSFKMVPFGNARETKQQNSYSYQCQHGKEECNGNLHEVCAMDVVGDKWLSYVLCLENLDLRKETFLDRGSTCSKKLGVDFEEIKACINGPKGAALNHEAAQKTLNLQPGHQYVPWLVFDGEHSEDLQSQGQENLIKLICNLYKGKKAKVCDQFLVSYQTESTNEFKRLVSYNNNK